MVSPKNRHLPAATSIMASTIDSGEESLARYAQAPEVMARFG